MSNEEIRELKCDLAEARAEVITCGFGVGMRSGSCGGHDADHCADCHGPSEAGRPDRARWRHGARLRDREARADPSH